MDTTTHEDVWEVEVKFHAFLNSEMNGKLHVLIVLPGNTVSSILVTAMDIKASRDSVPKILTAPAGNQTWSSTT